MAEEKRYGADLIVESLTNHGIDYVLGFLEPKLTGFLKVWSILNQKRARS